MAVKARHARTATLIDGSNPDEIQAADWNADHPITADNMGLLFASGGTVTETMTADLGTATASAPLTVRQAWSDGTNTVDFKTLVVRSKNVNESSIQQGSANSSILTIQTEGAGGSTSDLVRFRPDGTDTVAALRFRPDFESDPVLTFDPSGDGSFQLGPSSNYSFFQSSAIEITETGVQSATYSAYGITLSLGASFTLPASTQTALAQWAGAPSTSDIASGYAQVGKDTSTGNIWLAVNDGGTIKKVQLT